MQLAVSRAVMRCAHLVGRLLLALGVGLGALGPAAATTFVRMDETHLAARATAVVIGTVRAVRTEASATRVTIDPERIVAGHLAAGPLTLDEPGGRAERLYGAPDYRPGERVLVFASRRADGTWRTTGMAMGKYLLDGDRFAVRVFGEAVAVIDPESGAVSDGPLFERLELARMLARLRGEKAPPTQGRDGGQGRGAGGPTVAAVPDRSPFTYLGQPSRWFEPDAGVPIVFGIDLRGDATLGSAASVAAAVDALAAWTTLAGTGLLLADQGLSAPAPFAGCSGGNRIVFGDPFGEIDPPVDCRGVLGIGGYCYSDERRTVNGTSFNRIRLGKVTMADGFGACPLWTPCNVAQILTHEVGHAIGLGHSTDAQATMAASARFDGRCAALAADDALGARFIYPPPPTATPSPTPSFTALPPTLPPTATGTATPRSTDPAGTPPPGPYRISGRVAYYSNDAAVPAVAVELEGAARRHAGTAADGTYGFDDVPGGALLLRPQKLGDAGAALSALDAAYVLQASAGLRALNAVQQLACDVTGNGSVSPLDAARILQRVVGVPDPFPAATTCAADWLFVPAAAPVPNLEAVAPALLANVCRAGSLSYTPLGSDAPGQDFRAALLGDCTGNWLPSGDARAAEPKLAPRGTALVMEPIRRVRGGRWRLAAGVRGPAAMRALELELRYDADRLTPVRVRAARLGYAALIDSRIGQPGRLTIALASAVPLPADGRAVVVVDFAATVREVSSRLVRPYAIAVDERLVPTPER